MDDLPSDSALQEALDHFMFADTAPSIAEALHELAALTRSASGAVKRLVAAVEEWSAPIVSYSEIEYRHKALLEEHRATWTALCSLRLPSRTEPQVGDVMRRLWEFSFLRVIIDRMWHVSSEFQYRNITLVRIFGSTVPKLRKDQLWMTDGEGHCTVLDQNSWSFLPSDLPGETLFALAVRIADVRIQATPAAIEGRQIIISDEPRTLYSYGPISDHDREVRLDALHRFAAALDWIEQRMISAADLFAKDIRNKDFVWKFMIENGITPTVMSRALAPHRKVEAQAIQMGLRRYRNRLTCAAVDPSRKSQPDKPTRARAAVGSTERPCQQTAQRARRKGNTP